RNLGFGPHPHDTHLYAIPSCVGSEDLRECRISKVVEGGCVNHVNPGLRRRGEDERGACAIPDAVLAELMQVALLQRIAGIVPVANVYHRQTLASVLVRPRHEARNWPLLRVSPQQTLGLRVTYVKRIGQGVVSTE